MDDSNDLPSQFDVIVLGTGMPESIVAAAAARVGRTVLHIDRNEYYGGNWASFNFDNLLDWSAKQIASTNDVTGEHDLAPFLKDGEQIMQIESNNGGISNANVTQSIADEGLDEVEGWTMEKLKKERRKFNLDLAPKLLFSRGPLVELLISSNISRYAEFKSSTRVLTMINDKLLQVPCSRADVFSTKDVSIVEKRMLMKFLTFAVEYEKHPEEYKDFEDKLFIDFLKSKKLTSNVEHYLLHAIAMVDRDVTTATALTKIQCFLSCLGRYGNSPFLWPVYGSGELPQCFCRLCAVFGGVYYLNRKVQGLVVAMETDDRGQQRKVVKGIVTDGQRIDCKVCVADVAFAPQQFYKENEKLSRGIFITDRTISKTEKEQLTLLRIPSDGVASSVTVLELASGSLVCPKGLFVVHMTCKGDHGHSDFQPIVERLFSTEDDRDKPNVLWSVTFNQSQYDSNAMAENFYLTSPPDEQQDYQRSINEAREIFKRFNPDGEFLPRAPDPDEIIIGGDPTGENNNQAQNIDVNTSENIEENITDVRENISEEA